MTYENIVKGLDEAININKDELKGRRQKIEISPVMKFSSNEIKHIRTKLELTQIAFAQILGVSLKTVESWENGTISPSGPARRIIEMLKEDPKLPEKYHIISR